MMLKFLAKLIVLMLAVGAGRLAYLKFSALPVFALERIEIKGTSSPAVDSLIAVTGLEKGKSIYRQNLKYAADRLMDQAGVVRCSIARGLLSTITVEVSLAEPIFILNAGKLYGLSREGLVLPLDQSSPVLPLVTGINSHQVKCFSSVESPDVACAIELYYALMASCPELYARLSEVNLPGGRVMYLYFSPQGTQVVMDMGDIPDSVRRLSRLASAGMLEGERIFDLRFGAVIVESSVQKGIL